MQQKFWQKVIFVVGTYTYTYRTDGTPSGTVIEQHPQPGTEVVAGTAVSLVISSGPPTCPDCGSTDHLTHPVCEFCSSKNHLSKDHKCSLCGTVGEHADKDCTNKPEPTPGPTIDPNPNPTTDPNPVPTTDPNPAPEIIIEPSVQSGVDENT